MNKTTILILLVVVAALPALAQSSASYKLEEHVFNAGGHPADGLSMASASYRIRLDAIGESLLGRGMSGPSYGMDAGFGSAYPPPGEVPSLWFADHDTLHWAAERSAGTYNLYRDLMSDVAGGGYGDCHDPTIAGTTASDTETPPSSDGWFYLVTAENRLGEEGTKGFDDGGAERLGTACP